MMISLHRLVPLFAVLIAFSQRASAQGSITPSGPPTTPVMKTLNQVEPRSAIAGGTKGYVISSPGSYYLTGNISITGDDTPLLISSSNVTVDLNGYTLSLTGNTVALACITVNQPSVTIRNGSLSGGAIGVLFEHTSTTARGSRIESLNINGCTQTGIDAGVNVSGVKISGCVITNIGSSSLTSAANGITAGGSDVVENCYIDTVINGNGSKGVGLQLNAKCIASGNRICNCNNGIISGKCANNLTINTVVPFTTITDAGGNN